MRVVSIVGARPQFVKLAPVAKAFAAGGIEHKIIHTGQHYDVNMSDSFFVELGIPNPDLHLGVGGGSHGVMTGRMLEQLDPVLEDMDPDWVLVYGDTNSTIAGTLSAVKMHLPVAHLEAGLRSFNRRMPEEHNRVLTDHAADLCLAPTEVAMGHLADEGLASRAVLVGDVMTDVCLQVRDSVLANPRPVPGVAPGEEYVMATIHRADNTDDPKRLAHILDALGSLDRKVILPVHPRLRARAEADGITIARGNLTTIDPLAYPDMVNAVTNAAGVIPTRVVCRRKPSCSVLSARRCAPRPSGWKLSRTAGTCWTPTPNTWLSTPRVRTPRVIRGIPTVTVRPLVMLPTCC